MDADTYAGRLALAMDIDAKTQPKKRKALIQSLADALAVTPQAVEKALRGGSNAMSARNNARAARHLSVNAEWLATGEGDMRSALAWPFGDKITPEQFFALDASAVQPAIDILQAALLRSGALPGNVIAARFGDTATGGLRKSAEQKARDIPGRKTPPKKGSDKP